MREKLTIWLAWKLPRALVYWCAIRLMAHATQGEYGNQEVPALLAMDALRRWRSDAPTGPWNPAAKPERWRGISFLSPHDGPVVPGQENDEIVFAKNQPEYIPLRALAAPGRERAVLTRWSPDAEQRERVAEGEDIYLRLLTFGGPLQPPDIHCG